MSNQIEITHKNKQIQIAIKHSSQNDHVQRGYKGLRKS